MGRENRAPRSGRQPSDDPPSPLAAERETAERNAWDSLARYKFMIFGYWCGIWVHLNRLCAEPKPNPWKDLVAAARRRTQKEIR